MFYATSLQDDLKKIILCSIKNAKKSIHLQMYGLTDPEIINLIEKKSFEGLDIAIFYDTKATFSLPRTIPSYPIHASGLMHRKILTIDGILTFMGTANFTTQSLKMHDNLILGIYNPSFTQSIQESTSGHLSFDVENTHTDCYLLPENTKEAIEALCQKIDKAKKTIRIAMFTLTNPTLLHHLLEAKKRDVEIELAIDKYARSGSSKATIDTLKKAGATILLNQGKALFHHKWAWIDEEIFCLGSANWTSAAFGKNQDFLLIFESLGKHESNKLNKLWQKIAKRNAKE